MPKNISRRKLINKLRTFGFVGLHSGGKHEFMKRGELKLHIPNKHQKDISASLVSRRNSQTGGNKQRRLG